MKTQSLTLLLTINFAAAAMFAQTPNRPDIPAGAKVAITLATAEKPTAPSGSLQLKHNEALRTFEVEVQSDDDKPMKVYGVQTTGGLWVVDFPAVITPKGKASVTLLYYAKPNTNSSSDVLRLLTDRGEKIVLIKHDREQAATFDQTSLQWQQGDPIAAKSVIVTMSSDTSVPKTVRVMGTGNAATIQSLGNNRYQISVTPGSTAKPQQFPVFIDFVPALPGLNNVIACTVEPRG